MRNIHIHIYNIHIHIHTHIYIHNIRIHSESTYNFLDVFKTGAVDARNLEMRLKVDNSLARVMISDGDENRDNVLDVKEFQLIARTRE